jgi:hypothetical protein
MSNLVPPIEPRAPRDVAQNRPAARFLLHFFCGFALPPGSKMTKDGLAGGRAGPRRVRPVALYFVIFTKFLGGTVTNACSVSIAAEPQWAFM